MAVLAASAISLQANIAADNPYASIVDRNPFGLKEPPPPAPPPSENIPKTPPAKVTLTGLISMFGQPQVLLEIFDEPKGGGMPKKPILRQGERMGDVEVLEIDVEKNIVKIRNSGMETNLTFEVAKATAAAPGVPGIPTPPGAIPPPTGRPSPTVVSGNGNTGGGVTLMGGTAASPATADAYQNQNTGLRSIPQRPIRTDYNTAAAPPPMTREQANLLHSVVNQQNMQRGLPPLPTGNMNLNDGDGTPNPGGPPQLPQFPQFPRPGGPPRVPGR